MSAKVKEEVESLKEVIFNSITDDRFSGEDVVLICKELISYLEDEKMGMEDLLQEKKY